MSTERSEQGNQGALFIEVTETVAAVDPAHLQGRKVIGYEVGPSFADTDSVDESDNELNQPQETADSPAGEWVDSHKLVSSVVADISAARQLDGLTKGGVSSARVHRQAMSRRTTPEKIYNDAIRRASYLEGSAKLEYEKWIRLGAAFVSLATQKNIAPSPILRFQDLYWDSKTADRRRVKLQRRLKK